MIDTPRRKAVASLAVIAALGGLASYGILGAFTAQSVNSGNEFSSATLELASSNHVTSEPVYFAENAVPGDSGDTDHSCIEITYTGTVPAEVRMYGKIASAGTGLAPGVMLRITEGAGGTDDGCASFSASGSAGDVFGGSSGNDLQSVRSFHSTWDGGFELGEWQPGESGTFRFESWLNPLVDSEEAQGKDAGVQSFVWEARAGA